jgi:hypothetical protein
LVGWSPRRVHAVRGERDPRLPGRPDRTRPLGIGARAGGAQPAGHGLARHGRADAGRATVVAPCAGHRRRRDPPRRATGLVPRRPTHPHSAFRRSTPNHRDGFGRHVGRPGFHRLHRPQHQLRQPGLGGNHVRWPASHRGRRGHHPARALAGDRAATARLGRLAVRAARRRLRHLRRAGAGRRRPGGGRAPIGAAAGMRMGVRVPRRRRDGSLERAVERR